MMGVMSELAIDVRSVSKIYRGRIHALKGAALQVKRGEIFGLLGPNGAGKSTLVKILLSIVRPTEASGTLLGQPLGRQSTLSQVGYLPEQAKFPDYLTGLEVLDYIGGLHRVPLSRRRSRGRELLDLVGLSDAGRRPLRTYSKGMKQRLGLAQALINDPELLFLDEPTDGLDPVGRRDVAQVMRRLRERGMTVFLNSHLLGEAEQLCDRVAILAKGQVVRQGTVAELTRTGLRYEVRVQGALPDDAEVRAVLAPTQGQLTYNPTTGGTVIALEADTAELLQPLIDTLRRRQVVIEAITPQRQSLEDYFIGVVQPGVEAPPALPQ